MGIKKNTEISLVLTAEEINLILDGLANLPYKQVFHLIKKVQNQVVAKNSEIVQELPKSTHE